MRRLIVIAFALTALLATSVLPAYAQAPQPKVTIDGLIDNVTNYNRNSNMTGASRARGGITDDKTDTEWYSRIRGRWNITGEVGKGKAVLGLELDLIYGQTAGADNCLAVGFVGCRPDGTSGSFDADNDVRAPIELRWMYVDFPITGPGSLLPFIPVPGKARVGGQPYSNTTYKPFIFAASDFGGLDFRLDFNPQVNFHFTFAQFEEASTGPADGFVRGDDWGIIGAVELKPIKGLQTKVIYAHEELIGVTSANIRRATGGFATGAANFPTAGRGTGSSTNAVDERNWIGLDARYSQGPWYVAPTFFYQWGEFDRFNTTAGFDASTRPGLRDVDVSAWILDIEAGYRLGALNLQGRFMWTPGVAANHDLNENFNVYQPFQTGNAYWIGWGEAHGIGLIDYLTSLNGFSNSVSLPAQPSYDRYGRIMFSAKATYSLTPALSVYGIVTPSWTDEDVDTRGTLTAAGITPSATPHSADDNYLGTDLTAGLTWRFAPSLTFDWVGGLFIPGGASEFAGSNTAGNNPSDAENVWVTSARVRFTF